jgi:hypothetical protein
MNTTIENRVIRCVDWWFNSLVVRLADLYITVLNEKFSIWLNSQNAEKEFEILNKKLDWKIKETDLYTNLVELFKK